MPEVKDPELLQALRAIFASRGDLRTIVEYQQRLYKSIQELNANHKAMHDHVRSLTESHNQVRMDANDLLHLKREINDTVRAMSESQRQTREEATRAVEAIAYVQQELNKIAQLEQRIIALEQLIQAQSGSGQSDKKPEEHSKRLRKHGRKQQ